MRLTLSDKPILVPLTTSLYVPGTLADTDNVIVEVGTGYYVEKVGSSYICSNCITKFASEHRGRNEIL